MGTACLSLNPYHEEFLKHLLCNDVRFLVIGGQARAKFQDYMTKDLDLWIEFADANLDRYAVAHSSWADKFPNHIHPTRAHPKRVDFSKNTQIHIPDADVTVIMADKPYGLTEANKIGHSIRRSEC